MHRGKDKQDNVRATFKNTRSKFYNKQPSFDRQQKSSPNNQNTGEYWKQKGNQTFKQAKYNQAIQYYTKAIELNPGESQYYSNRSKCQQKNKNYIEALKDAEAAVQLNQNNIKAHYMCGCILAELGKNDDSKLQKAENRFKKALRLCATLAAHEYEQQISIKSFRLKKLVWLKQHQKQLKSLHLQKTIIHKAYQKLQITKHDYELINHSIQRRLQKCRQTQQIPDFLICKITLQLMEDPVMSEGGFTYQRKALEQHYKSNGYIEPLTRKQTNGKVFPNMALKQAVQQFLNDHPWAFEQETNQDYRLIPF